MKFAYALGAALVLAACAKSPSSIPPASVDSDEYSHLDCSELNTELVRTSDKLAQAIKDQNSAQTGDAITVFLFLVPVSALAGDSEAEVAQYKGEKLAIERSLDKNEC